MHDNYKIENTVYLNPEKEYLEKNIYPKFQEDYLKFKNELIKNSESRLNKTYYKFGDGDYFLFKNEKFGSTKPGVRDIKRSFKPLNIENILEFAHMQDKYFCEIINFYMMKEVINKPIDYPAEYLYASVANKWFFSQFDKITLIGSDVKLELIFELMKYSEYQDYLGIDKFYDYISIPQTGVLSNSTKVYRKIKNKVEQSKPDIFLMGIGLSQNILLPKLKNRVSVPLVSVGSGIDAIAGVMDIYRPYYGSWKNYRIKKSNLYKKIDDSVLYSTKSGPSVVFL